MPRSTSTAVTSAPVSASASVSEPSPAPISTTWSSGPTRARSAIRRTVFGSATKFCPRSRRGASVVGVRGARGCAVESASPTGLRRISTGIGASVRSASSGTGRCACTRSAVCVDGAQADAAGRRAVVVEVDDRDDRAGLDAPRQTDRRVADRSPEGRLRDDRFDRVASGTAISGHARDVRDGAVDEDGRVGDDRVLGPAFGPSMVDPVAALSAVAAWPPISTPAVATLGAAESSRLAHHRTGRASSVTIAADPEASSVDVVQGHVMSRSRFIGDCRARRWPGFPGASAWNPVRMTSPVQRIGPSRSDDAGQAAAGVRHRGRGDRRRRRCHEGRR